MRKVRDKGQNPKSQIPKSKEEAGESSSWWEEAGTTNGALVLRDGLVTDEQRTPYDLEERTAQFGEAVIRFSKRIPRDPGNNRLIGQLVGCGTSVGANYREANESVSKKDFRFSVSRCIKEAKETMFYLRMVAAAEPALAKYARVLYREARELVMILSSMYRK